jgi:hypothetical protein
MKSELLPLFVISALIVIFTEFAGVAPSSVLSFSSAINSAISA